MLARIMAVLGVALAVLACGGSRDGVITVEGKAPVTVTEDDLAKYVVWWRDFMTVGNRHTLEADAITKTVAAKYSLAETGRIAYDPELLEALQRQRVAMKEVMDRMPVGGLKMDALNDTVRGVATLEIQGEKVVYVKGRNEIALAAARKKYGDAFVDWIVSRERVVEKILSN